MRQLEVQQDLLEVIQLEAILQDQLEVRQHEVQQDQVLTQPEVLLDGQLQHVVALQADLPLVEARVVHQNHLEEGSQTL